MPASTSAACIIAEMLDSNSVNQVSISDALAAADYGSESFNSVFKKYSTALIYSTEDIPNDILVTNKDSLSTVNGIDYNQLAFDIYSYNNSVDSPGPLLFTIDSQLSLRPYGMSVHSDNTWLGMDGIQTINCLPLK